MFYIIIESTHVGFIVKNKLIEYKTQPITTFRKQINLNLMNINWISTFSLNDVSFHYLMTTDEYLPLDTVNFRNLNYLELYEILTNINLNAFLLWSKLYLSTSIFRLSFVFNAKYFTMYTNSLENYPQLYLNISSSFTGMYTENLIGLNLRVFFLKITNLLKMIKCFYKKPGSPYLRVRKIFPAVNIAFGFKISKYVLLSMNLVDCLMPLIFIS